jgi:enediyne biosynthesis protein E4
MKTKSARCILLVWAGAILNVPAQPVIVTQPVNQTNCAESTATFSVEALGTDTLTYQWRTGPSSTRATNDMSGETNATLIVTNVQSTRFFSVVVADGSGLSVTSTVARSQVLLPVGFTQQSTNVTLDEGSTFFSSVTVTGSPPISYQWYFNGQLLPGKTTNSLSIPDVQTNNAGGYWVSVINPCASLTSQVAILRVIQGPFTKIRTNAIATDAIPVWALAWGDYDNDGLMDLFAGVSPGSSLGTNALYHNEGNGAFRRVYTGPGAEGAGCYFGGVWADLNNDGWLDLYAADAVRWYNQSATPHNLLFQGGSGAQFTRITQDPAVTLPLWGAEATWGDFDNDGYVDLFVAASSTSLSLTNNYLFHNTGQGGFMRVPDPIFNVLAEAEDVGASDYDNDGDLDLLISCHNQRLFYTNNGDGTFTRITTGPIVSDTGNSAGFAWGDYDNDGRLDLCLATFDSNLHLFHNETNGTFTRTLLGNASNYQAPTWVDYDNDGHLDLFVTCGYVSTPLRNWLFRNNGDGTFTEVTDVILAKEGGYSAAQAWADYDNDGFLDLVVANSYTTGMFMYHNNGNTNHWLSVRLEGTRSNRAAIGAKVRVLATIGGKTFWQMREISGGCSRGQSDPRAHFGLGDATNVEVVRVEWPSGQVTELRNVASKQFTTIVEPNLQVAALSPNEVQLTVAGRIGSRYEIRTTNEVTAPLSNWAVCQCVTNTRRFMTVPITNVQESSQRFYRVVQP